MRQNSLFKVKLDLTALGKQSNMTTADLYFQCTQITKEPQSWQLSGGLDLSKKTPKT